MPLKPSVGTGRELSWFKSSYSGDSNSNECLEVAWQKSSYSNSNERDDCIEVATTPDTIHIRDSKNPHGPQLHLRPAAWADFVAYAAARG
ncbi:protein of unknown function [Streptomyces sp. 2112.3]|uniref:DUF397 domain-containing protein n=1 Tax=Streptomyces sp. 2112.3 TaxID=1881023 RepID=UPI000895D5B1|nr:DUF397 domain-containing protein [Streptomyces sp. 2112.3]SEE68573.1 protein of unknown function [Streptomyces sp. 2112.3]